MRICKTNDPRIQQESTQVNQKGLLGSRVWGLGSKMDKELQPAICELLEHTTYRVFERSPVIDNCEGAPDNLQESLNMPREEAGAGFVLLWQLGVCASGYPHGSSSSSPVAGQHKPLNYEPYRNLALKLLQPRSCTTPKTQEHDLTISTAKRGLLEAVSRLRTCHLESRGEQRSGYGGTSL